MRNGLYILDKNGEPVEFNGEVEEWGRWFENGKDRIVHQEFVGQSKVSTVFLALDHAFRTGPPVLWETMVFGGKLDQHQRRCCGGREQAEAMHQEVVREVAIAEGVVVTTV